MMVASHHSQTFERVAMFKRDEKTGEEIAYRVTKEDGRSTIGPEYVGNFYRDTPEAKVEEVRGHTHSRGIGFVVERVIEET
jgi:hypothetical protein